MTFQSCLLTPEWHHMTAGCLGNAVRQQQRQDAMLASNPPQTKTRRAGGGWVGGSGGPAVTFASGSKLLVCLDRWEQRGGRRISADATFLSGCVRKDSRGCVKKPCPLPPINSDTSTMSPRKVCSICHIKPMQIYMFLLFVSLLFYI